MIEVWTRNRERVNEAIDGFFIRIGQNIYELFCDAGRGCIFFAESVRLAFKPPYRFEEIVRHMEFIGNKSVLIIAMTSVFTGLALSFQIYLGFNLVNATNLVGPTVGMGITRELGPVLTGLLVAARAGGAMAARLGTMRVSEQIDALEVMGVDPKQYLVAPRIIAAVVVVPLLCAIFDFIAMMGSHFLCINVLKLDQAVFWDKISLWLNPGDIYQGLIKAAVFGVTFAAVCTNRGFMASGGAKGVGEATNQGVVNSMVLIIILNFFMTNFIRFYYVAMGWK
ncbi:MAG: ABC transporter permease [Bdellovibrionales bacterium]|nr:ABC transporter permease [Bdellovibrionales bacterium]